MEPGIPRSSRELRIGEPDAVGGRLEVGKPHFPRFGHDFEKPRVQRRLASRELDSECRRRALGAKTAEHLHHLFERRFERIPVGVREADRAGQIAAPGEVDVGEGGVRRMRSADAATVRALLPHPIDGVRESLSVPEVPLLEAEVHLHIREDDVGERAVIRTTLSHHHPPLLFVQPGGDRFKTLRAQGTRFLREGRPHGKDLLPSERVPPLHLRVSRITRRGSLQWRHPFVSLTESMLLNEVRNYTIGPGRSGSSVRETRSPAGPRVHPPAPP